MCLSALPAVNNISSRQSAPTVSSQHSQKSALAALLAAPGGQTSSHGRWAAVPVGCRERLMEPC